ncbi:MAG TPA: hypothetical protein ENH91_04620 [Leeuwenhoekiella sp.]|nr:hypothetical protein [Leeuwenhoekiella sp.]
MKEEEKIEILADKYLTNLPLDRLSFDFSAKVMTEITASEINKARFSYKPLISKPVWATFFAIMGAVFVYFLISGQSSFQAPDFSWFPKQLHSFTLPLANFKLPVISGTVISSILIFSFMALIEISVIKRLFDRRTTQ